ncbi:MAG: restriction endonuclease [Lentisphaeria bacterium]|nr:restriction endonuclease [Lentisphaeria bacterium]
MTSKRNKLIQVFEWEHLPIGEKGFSEVHFDKLVKWQEEQKQGEKSPYFKVGYKKVTFLQWVGVLQVDDLVIEIIPKAGKGAPLGEDRQDSLDKWKKVLVKMLRESQNLKLRHSQNTDLSIQKQSLFDLYYREYLQEVETLLHRGIVKKYRIEAKNRTALKGKLNFSKQINQNLIHKERFYTEASEYDAQNKWNEILLAALRITAVRANAGLLRSHAKNLELSFPDWATGKITAHTFGRLHYDRKTAGYKRAIDLARLILLQLNPQFDAGKSSVTAILFDMNVLWESWLLARYRRFYRNHPTIKVPGKKKTTFWMSENNGSKQLETDILIQKGEDEFMVIDAKWKIPKESKPDDNDLKQMFVYNLMWKSKEAWLVYPKINENQQPIHGKYNYGENLYMGMHFIDPLKDCPENFKLPECSVV